MGRPFLGESRLVGSGATVAGRAGWERCCRFATSAVVAADTMRHGQAPWGPDGSKFAACCSPRQLLAKLPRPVGPGKPTDARRRPRTRTPGKGASMRTISVTPEEMAARACASRRSHWRSARRTPPPPASSAEASQALTADVNYTYMAPSLPNNSLITAHAAIRAGGDAGDAISLSMAVCEPGHGPEPTRMHTVEAFFASRAASRSAGATRGRSPRCWSPTTSSTCRRGWCARSSTWATRRRAAGHHPGGPQRVRRRQLHPGGRRHDHPALRRRCAGAWRPRAAASTPVSTRFERLVAAQAPASPRGR